MESGEKRATDSVVTGAPMTDPATPSNRHDAQDQPAARKPLAFHLSFVAILVNLFLYALDATTLAVATPAIAADLNGTSLEAFWASISYLLAVAVTQPLYATVSDVLGRKLCLYVSYALFFAGSILFALAKNMAGIIAGRTLQGLGGGGLDVLSEIIVTDMTTLQERATYLGLMAIPTALGSVLGPSIGGVFSSLVTWRWLGWLNLPLLAISVSLSVSFLRLQPIRGSRRTGLKRLDWIGIPLFTSGTILFALPLSWAGNLFPWATFQTLLPLCFGVALLALFAWYESVPSSPIMPHRLFKSKTASATLVGVFLHGASLYSLLQWLPLLYQAVTARTVLESAVALLPTSVVSVVAAVGGVIITGVADLGYRWSIRVAWALMTGGTGLLILLGPDPPTSLVYGLPVVWGVGVGLLLRLLYLPLQASVARVDDNGLAVGVLLTFRLLGGLVGLSMCSTVFSSYFSHALHDVSGLPPALANLHNTEAAVAFIPKVRNMDTSQELSNAVVGAYLTSIRAIMYMMTACGGLGFLSSFLVTDLSLQKTEMSQQHFEH